MQIRELAIDAGWLLLLIVLLPLAIPLGALAFAFLLGQRLHAWSRRRMQADYAG